MEDQPRLSRWLYNILEGVGASEKLRRLHRRTATAQEIHATLNWTFTSGRLRNYFICGSRHEGSVTPDLVADIDCILCQSYVLVGLDTAQSPPGESFLMVRDRWTYPGYFKLQLVVDGQSQNGYHRLPVTHYDIDSVERVCLKHIQGKNMHGPAEMSLDENGVHISDYVRAFKCDHIHPSALEWILRPRPYDWPSQEQLQTMGRMGCMVVGVGHVKSSEKEIEWRLSYSLQERMLMSNLNPVQHKVYILLKLVKKEILGNIFHAETLTSYHCKTCVLYAVQMTPSRAWTPDNLINCLLQCLKLMIRWLDVNYCPSYLVKDQNLFLKEGFTLIRKDLLIEIRQLVQSGSQFLYMLQSDNIGAVLRGGDWRMLREITTQKQNEYVTLLKQRLLKYVGRPAFSTTLAISGGRYDPFTLTFCLEILQREWQVNEHTVEETRSALAYWFPWLHLHIAKGLASLTFTCSDRAARQRVMEMADFHLQEARGLDLVNERLAVASVLYASEKYEECCLLLELIENEFTYQVLLCCPCTITYADRYYDIRDKHERNKKIANMPMRQIIKSMTACCVTFLPSAAAIAPDPLQYEMRRSLGTLPGSRDESKDFWFDWAVVDAKIYLYFMQYLVSTKLNKEKHRQVARENLRAEIAEDDLRVMTCGKSGLGHKDTAYNLLGWIYMQEHRFAEAYVCFGKSWKIRPFHNAAKYHMRDLMVKVLSRCARN